MRQAHRPGEDELLPRVVKALLIAILLIVVLIAWSAVPEPDLMAWNH